MTIKLRYIASLFVTGAAAAAIAAAPTAAAAPSCVGSGNATICQRGGHTAITTNPPVNRAPTSVYGPFLPSHYPFR